MGLSYLKIYSVLSSTQCTTRATCDVLDIFQMTTDRVFLRRLVVESLPFLERSRFMILHTGGLLEH